MPRLPGVRRLFRLPDTERDVRTAVDDELTFHLEMAVAELVAAGHPPEAARREAERRFGDLERVRRDCVSISTRHDTAMRRADWFASIGQDLVYALRGARRAPGFSLIVLLTLALGIGATTAMFSVVRGVLLRPLPFPAAHEVVRIWPANRAADEERGNLSTTELEDWERELRGFTAVGAFRTFANGSVYGDAPEPAYVPNAYVSRGFFAALGTQAALGRTFTADEHVEGRNRSVVVSDGFWRQQLGGDPRVVGRTVRLDGEAYTVVGVMPADFGFPSPDVAVWMSSSLLGPDDVGAGREARWLDVVARLRPGTTPAQGRAEVEALLTRLAAEHPESNAGWTAANVEDVRDSIVGRVRRGLLVLLGAVGLVLLAVCANVANLTLVRGTGRARELALRAAIGASRGRVIRQLLTESVLLALLGGALGVLAAWWGVRTLVALGGSFLPRAADVRLDGAVLAFAVVVSVLTGVVFGVWPALRASVGARLSASLRDNGRGSVGGSGASTRARAALVTAEVALAVVLVVGAGLMLRSFQRLAATDPGFRADGVLLVRFAIEDEGTNGIADIAAARQRVVERVRAVPGVVAAGATKDAPLASTWGEGVPFVVPGRPAVAPGSEPRVHLQPASPGYFRTLGIPLLAGEDIAPPSAGDSTAGAVAIISRRMAEQIWPGESPIGRTFEFMKIPVRVVGIVGDVRTTRLDSASGYVAYLRDQNMTRSSMSLVVRTGGDPARLAEPVRAAIREVLPGQAFREVVPLRSKLSEAVATPRFFTVLVALFGALALALAAVGLYGVVAYVARQREREIGVRLALGAPPRQVLTLVLGQGMKPVFVGLAVGLGAAVAGGRVLQALLYEVSVVDPLTFAVVPAIFAAVALLAAWVPSWRAARVHPAVTLRAD